MSLDETVYWSIPTTLLDSTRIIKRSPPELPPRDPRDSIDTGCDVFIPDKRRLLLKGLTANIPDAKIFTFLVEVCKVTPKCIERGQNATFIIVVLATDTGIYSYNCHFLGTMSFRFIVFDLCVVCAK